MTMRLSQSSLTGTERTLVAVGTARLASMLATVRAGAPRRAVYFGSSSASFFACACSSVSCGLSGFFSVFFSADFSGFFSADFSTDFWGFFSASDFFSGSADVLEELSFFSAFSGDFSGDGDFCPEPFCPADVERRVFGAPVDSVTLPPVEGAGAFWLEPLLREDATAWRWSLPKKSHHTLSTLFGSSWYFSYISSTSHSLAPKPDLELSPVDSGTADLASSERGWVRPKASPRRQPSAGRIGAGGPGHVPWRADLFGLVGLGSQFGGKHTPSRPERVAPEHDLDASSAPVSGMSGGLHDKYL